MKLIIFSLFFLPVYLLNALSIDEFNKLEASKQIGILYNPPSPYKIDIQPESVLKLYSAGLSAKSSAVRRIAAQMSGLLMSGIQSADPAKIPDFPQEDTLLLQQRLLSALKSEDKYTRMGAAEGLAYSSSPDAQIEHLLLRQFANEEDAESKVSILVTMGIAGYKSNDIAIGALSLLEKTEDKDVGHASHRAAKLLGLLKNPSVLKRLATIAQGKNSIRSMYALQAIACYGESAVSIQGILNEIINDPYREKKVTNYATFALNAINSGEENPSGLKIMNTRRLWPLALSKQNEFKEEQFTSDVKSPKALTAKSKAKQPIKLNIDQIPLEEFESTNKEPDGISPKEDVEQSSNRWPWFIGILVIVGVLGLVVRRKN